MPKINLYSGKRPKKLRPELLLHPQIPKPLHGLNPRTIKGRDWWRKQKDKVYKKSNYYCICCGVHITEAKYRNWLEAHECYDICYITGVVTFIEVVPLCYMCHSYIHQGFLNYRLDNNLISRKEYEDILTHGDKIIKKNKLLKPLEYLENLINWENWVLVIGKRKYKSKFKSIEDWEKYYENMRQDAID